MTVMRIITETFGSVMKKSFLIASLALFAVLTAGCMQELRDTPESGNKTTLTVSAVTKSQNVSEEAGTKVSYGAIDATWETGDRIYLIKNDGTTITLTLIGGAGTATGSFSSTDPVAAGTYIPYAVSKSSLDKGFVSVSSGVITLNLSTPGGGSLAEALEHDILKGSPVVLTADQTTATIGDLTTHILSYLRFRFTSTTKAISTIGMDSAGGVYRTVNIAANGTVSGSNPSTDVVNVTASDDGAGTYAGYFAVLGNTSTSLMAHAEIHRRVDEDLIDGIDVDILWRDVFQIDLIDLCAHLDIPGHLRHGDEIAQRLAWVGKLRCVRGLALENVVRRQRAALVVDLFHPAHDLKQPCAPGDAVLIGHNQMRCERIEIPVPAGHGGIKGLQVDRNIGFVRLLAHKEHRPKSGAWRVKIGCPTTEAPLSTLNSSLLFCS